MDCSMPGSSVLHHLPEFAQIHAYWVSDAIQPSHPLPPASPPAINLFQHQGFSNECLFLPGGQSIGVSASASVLPMNIQGSFPSGLTGLISLQSKGFSKVISSTTIWNHPFFGTQSSLWPNSFEIKLFPLELYWAMTCNLFRNFPLSGTLVAVQSLSRVQLFVTPWTAASQASLSFTISWSLFKLTSIESVMPSNHLILYRPLLPPSIFPSIRVFSNESVLLIRWPKYEMKKEKSNHHTSTLNISVRLGVEGR